MDSDELKKNIERFFPPQDLSPQEHSALIELMALIGCRNAPPDPLDMMVSYDEKKTAFLGAVRDEDVDALEEAFLNLYVLIHGHQAPYTKAERAQLNATGGYWCHAGGLSPILKAGRFMQQDTVFADYGAGNGIQGLLVQKLWPHKKTILIEISSKMVAAGKALQNWLQIPHDRVEWVVGDVADTPPVGMDFIYLYRPLKPEGPGVRFYEKFARTLSASTRNPIVVFSVADCLKSFLPKDFRIFYNDGHLTCFERGMGLAAEVQK